MNPPSADSVLAAIRGALEPARDESRAAAMAAYMRDQFAFLGIATEPRRSLVRAALRPLAEPDEATVHAVARSCFALPEREYHYAGVEYLTAHLKPCTPAGTLPVVDELILTHSWWDTVDVLCRAGAGELVRHDRAFAPVMDRWLASDELWLIRSAILHQERWGAEIDFTWVASACVSRAEHPDFFVRKAIGWVLRTYARRGRVEADAVRALLETAPFSGLTRREALKRVGH